MNLDIILKYAIYESVHFSELINGTEFIFESKIEDYNKSFDQKGILRSLYKFHDYKKSSNFY